MSIYGVGNSGIQRTQIPFRDNGRTPAQAPVPKSLPQTITQAPANGKPATGMSAEPPAGTDPALWSVLSGEERAFFAKAGAMGPLTYGRAFQEMKSAQLPASRGGRLDVKV